MLVGCLGEVTAGEEKSLMEQLKGEALKFHKPGEKGPPEHTCMCLRLSLFFLYTPWEA